MMEAQLVCVCQKAVYLEWSELHGPVSRGFNRSFSASQQGHNIGIEFVMIETTRVEMTLVR